ncbi:MAG: cytochrome c [Chlorobium sp.]|jgi:cytochrome c|uniref:c-type cytochrome n=1 Tax=Chlorobium sp. TaxID=1095 RepID=UPI001DBEE3A5|nr:cytochrome c [Chlorobium sp.]MBN1278668.1 cytochrome c [Chlorobiaceae bacterium]MCF8216686.1 cytochrome c [Chlorobium sp.]MCF8270853.1 cytochrome c [Chlorobium sp.]MCF8287213.1 cytochrome c [Chlorobium sp.]MCF8290871.1 cytochrome c [Chlorobium sp.]
MKRIPIIIFTLLLCPPAAESATTNPDGKAVFEKNCSICHSITLPPKSAPPIVPVASIYHRQFTTKTAGVNHMVTFMKSPSKSASKVDPEAISRFGLMPAMELGDAELKAVAGWVWDQYNPNTGKGMGMGAGSGQSSDDCR